MRDDERDDRSPFNAVTDDEILVVNASDPGLVRELKELRRGLFENEFRYFEQLMRCEEKREAEWRQEAITFDRFLKKFGFTESQRYRSFVAAARKLGKGNVKRGLSEIKAVGVSAAIRIAEAKDASPAQVKQLVEHFKTSNEVRGFPISDEGARKQVERQTGPKPSGYAERKEKEQSREEALYAENVALKKRVKELERENAELRERLGRGRTK